MDRPHGYVLAVAPFWRREMLSSSSTGSNSWYQKSCHSPSSSKTSRAGWPGFPHLWAMVPTRLCNSALRWSFLTLTQALLALIHRSAWNMFSANFAYPEFSEVGIPALCVAPSLCGRILYVEITGAWP